MTAPTEQAFLNELDRKLRTAGDRLRSRPDAAIVNQATLNLLP